MHRLFLTSAATAIASLALASPSWAAWVWPLNGEVITPYSNGNNPYAGGQHRGIDIAGETGQPVVAAAGGSVRFAGTAGSSGLTVSIRTTDGFDSSYLHLSSASVREGQAVAAGQRIGAVGTSGTRSTERAHLHFGVREAGSRHAYRDPLGLLPALPPAPERPREAPAPQPAPTPVAPAPAPVPVSSSEPAPAPLRVGVRRREVVGGRATVGRRVPSAAGGLAPESIRSRSAAASPPPVPRAAPTSPSRRAVGPQPARAPEHSGQRHSPTPTGAGPAGVRPVSPPAGNAPEGPGRAVGAPPPQREPGAEASRGPDYGLLLACVGLLGAAVLLGLSEDGRAATRRTGQRAAGLLRPLLSRR